jgi:DedD protein
MASPPIIEDPSQASRRAKIRIGVAVTLLVTAIAILAMLNQHKTKPNAVPPAIPTAPQESLTSPQTDQIPTSMDSAQVEPPPAPPAAPVPPAPSETAPPPPVPGKLPPAPVSKPTTSPVNAEEKTGGGIISTQTKTPAPEPKPAVVPTQAKPTASAEPAKPVAPKDFEVQLGVFSDMENAKQLQAKLAEHGIPSHTETRVQVGPFKTRAEADQAREKLKALGISAVIAPK